MRYYDPVNIAKRIPKTCRVEITRAGLVKFTPGAGARLRKGLADVRYNDWFRRIEAFRQLPVEATSTPCARCDDPVKAETWTPSRPLENAFLRGDTLRFGRISQATRR